ncbi:Glycosyl transferase, family 31-containing protein [Aphelenchoides bicaudatus]|nr:Glycosyl transferase, family 31-containing protein [Aphelenchoides bicaudatus]
MWLRRYVDKAERFLLEPKHLLLLQFLWVLPYLFLSNYLERSLLPFRLVCYTEPELLQVQRPIRMDRRECIRYFFPDRPSIPRSECEFNQRVRTLLRPPSYKLHGINRVMVIRSAPSAYAYREYIRETWKLHVEEQMPVIFVSGTDHWNMTDEHLEHGDILQFDFVESYQNLTLKMMSIYRFVLEETSAEQIVVINDDTIVNSTALFNVCENQAVQSRGDTTSDYILGKVSRGYPRLIFPWLPWYVSSTVYPHKCYPPFVQGSSFVISKHAAAKILRHICEFPFVHLDDVMMGIVSNCLDIRNVHRDGFDQHTLDEFTVFHYQYSRFTTKQMRDSFTLIRHTISTTPSSRTI